MQNAVLASKPQTFKKANAAITGIYRLQKNEIKKFAIRKSKLIPKLLKRKISYLYVCVFCQHQECHITKSLKQRKQDSIINS